MKKLNPVVVLPVFLAAVLMLLSRADQERTAQKLIGLNGAAANLLHLDYSDFLAERGIYLTEYEGQTYIVSPNPETSTDYEFTQLQAYYNYAAEKGADFLYVNAPCKCPPDVSAAEQQFADEFCNDANADQLLARLRGAEIPCFDLRDAMRAEGKALLPMFYRTDHHWTVDSGFWAAEKVSAELNARFDAGIDLSVFEAENYEINRRTACWIGEQGLLLSKNYLGYDDFTVIKPKAPGSYRFGSMNGDTKDDSFDALLHPLAELSRPEKGSESLHYTYCQNGVDGRRFVNCDQPEGEKILLLCDSYSHVFIPFFLQGVGQIDAIIPRNHEEPMEVLADPADYDAVVLLYAEFMIGAHDDPDSANYHMFSLTEEE